MGALSQGRSATARGVVRKFSSKKIFVTELGGWDPILKTEGAKATESGPRKFSVENYAWK